MLGSRSRTTSSAIRLKHPSISVAQGRDEKSSHQENLVIIKEIANELSLDEHEHPDSKQDPVREARRVFRRPQSTPERVKYRDKHQTEQTRADKAVFDEDVSEKRMGGCKLSGEYAGFQAKIRRAYSQ